MKKLLALTLVLTLLFAGCTGNGKNNNTTGDNNTGNGTTNMSVAKAGLGIVSDNTESTTATADKAGNAQTDTYIAAIVLDADGKVSDAKLDCVQSKTGFDVTGALVGETGEVKSKKELGDAYGMKAASPIGKEWYEQVNALEDWMKGKTIDEITGMKTKEKDEKHPVVPDDPTISSSCTISIEGFLKAVAKAKESAK